MGRAEADKARASAESLQAEKATLADRLRALTKERFVVGKREHELAARLAEAEALAEQRPPPAVDCMVQTDALPAPPPTSEFGGYVDLKRENARLTRELAELRKAHVALLESSAHVPWYPRRCEPRSAWFVCFFDVACSSCVTTASLRRALSFFMPVRRVLCPPVSRTAQSRHKHSTRVLRQCARLRLLPVRARPARR